MSHKKPTHLEAVNARIAEVEADICKQMYCDDIKSALELAGSSLMRHEVHTVSLNDERAELSFLRLRKGQIIAAIDTNGGPADRAALQAMRDAEKAAA